MLSTTQMIFNLFEDSDLINEKNSEDLLILAENCNKIVEEKAIHFARWCVFHEWEFDSKINKWSNWNQIEAITSKELYKYYLKDIQQ